MFEPFTPSFFRKLQQLKIHTRRVYLGSRQGSHLSLRRGHGLEFSDYRHYAPGDDFRHIDWGVYARTDRLYVREFREEQDLNVMFLVDASRSMAYPESERKFEQARDLAIALGYVALSDGDTVTFAFLGQRITPKFIGARALGKIWAEFERIKPEGTFSLVNEVRAAVARHKYPGKCFLISDFLYDHQEAFDALDYLRSRNFDISLLRVMAPSELLLKWGTGNSMLIDSETGEKLDLLVDRASSLEYAKLLARHVEELEDYCRKAGIVHTLISSKDDFSELVLNRLTGLGILK